MTYTKLTPYLLRAFYNWLIDNKLTPYLVADVTIDKVHCPIEEAQEGKIVLNIAPCAVTNLVIGNDNIQFNASFKGVATRVMLPMASILAIYAHEEKSFGMCFPSELAYKKKQTQKEGPSLHIVK